MATNESGKTTGDLLAPHRDAVGAAIKSVRGFKHVAGSHEMRRAHTALDYLGMAYSVLQPETKGGNPAWADKGKKS